MPVARAIISKCAALGLAIALVAGAYHLAVAPLTERISQLRESLETQRELLGQLKQQLLTARAPVQDRSTETGQALFLTGESNAVMAAQVQTVLRAKEETSGWRLISTQALPVRQQGNLRFVGVEARLSASMAGLQRLLLAIDAARPVILVSTLQISPLAGQISDAGGEAEQLAVRLEIFGASAPPEPEVTDAKTPRR